MAHLLINKQNYFHNLDTINQKLQNIDKIAVVLKDNAYGHGLIEIAQIANEYGIKKAVVRTIKEAEQINHLFDYILVLGELPKENYSHTFHIAINSLSDIEKMCKDTIIHLKIDTGMHRNGISQNDLEIAISMVFKQGLILGGVFTHHRSSDVLSSEFYWQKVNFSHVKSNTLKICEKLSIPNPVFHSLNSSGVFRCKNIDDDFVRIGIASYGYSENLFPLEVPNLKPVASLIAKKISSTKLKKGQRVGYGGNFEAPKDMDISTYDIGYGDGFLRFTPSCGSYFTPKGYQILGNISMDCISMDCEDEEVVVFDNVTSLAKLHNTISYEITTALSPNLKRLVV